MKKTLIILLFLVISNAFSQGEHANWFFGERAGITFWGKYQFHIGNYQYEERYYLLNNPSAIENSPLSTLESSSSISDFQGFSIFATDGISHFGFTNNDPAGIGEISANERPLGNTGHRSSAQGAMIIRKPGVEETYYVFTAPVQTLPDESAYFTYNIIDVDMEGNPAIRENSYSLVRAAYMEQMTAVKRDESSIWIILKERRSNQFHSYLFDEQGLNTTPIISEAEMNIAPENLTPTGSTLTASHNGEMLVSTYNRIAPPHIYRFNKATGEVEELITVIENESSAYDAEFSSTDNMLYISFIDNSGVSGYIKQFLVNTLGESNQGEIVFSSSTYLPGMLQIAPNRKIYFTTLSQFQDVNQLAVIHFPELNGDECEVWLEGANLRNGIAKLGLPAMPLMNFFFDDVPQNCASLGEESVFNGDFELGDLGFETNMSKIINNQWDRGTYDVDNTFLNTSWVNCFEDKPEIGKALIVDASRDDFEEQIVWRQTIEVEKNRNYRFSFKYTSINSKPISQSSSFKDYGKYARFSVYFDSDAYPRVYSTSMDACTWGHDIIDWFSGNKESVVIHIREVSIPTIGLDFIIDDISFRECVNCASLSVDEEMLNFETPIFALECNSIEITNQSDYDYEIDLKDVYLSSNIEFSIPSAQFPITVPAFGSQEIEVCFNSNEIGYYFDKLTISKNSSCENIFDLRAESIPNEYSSDGKCQIGLVLNSREPQFESDIILSPNPASTEINISFPEIINTEIELKLITILGEVVFQEKFPMNGNFIKIDLTDIPSGSYMLNIAYGDVTDSRKISIIK